MTQTEKEQINSELNSVNTKENWYGLDYNPGLSVEDWKRLLTNENIFTKSSLEIMKRIKDSGGEASCKLLSEKYGETANFYNSGSVALARRICKNTNIKPPIRDKGNEYWWPILYIGRNTSKGEIGSFIWKLRDELFAAIDEMDLSNVQLNIGDNKKINYWWLNANPDIWNMSTFNVGQVQSYSLLNENGHKRRVYQNFLDAKAGDKVIGYASTPLKQVVALLQVCAEQDGEFLYFEKMETVSSPIDYSVLKECKELENMQFFQSSQGSLFKLTEKEYDFIVDMIGESNFVMPKRTFDGYTISDFLDDVYMNEKRYDMLVNVLEYKKNIILQGAPGVGKTFAAERLAWSIMGEKDDSRVEFVQFHQSYSYEDFVMGYKPNSDDDGFKLETGIFYNFCQKARDHVDKKYFFIIDEINRGNMSKIFGELLMLIEKDYRDKEVTLAYNGISFSVPTNIYIIGMMNTADRSLAMIDYALRRRFSFFKMEPGFDSIGFIKYKMSLANETFDELIEKIKLLNEEIRNDKSLGEGFCIGHSYFCSLTEEECTKERLQAIVDYDILPMLEEYWFDERSKLEKWKNILQGVFNGI